MFCIKKMKITVKQVKVQGFFANPRQGVIPNTEHIQVLFMFPSEIELVEILQLRMSSHFKNSNYPTVNSSILNFNVQQFTICFNLSLPKSALRRNHRQIYIKFSKLNEILFFVNSYYQFFAMLQLSDTDANSGAPDLFYIKKFQCGSFQTMTLFHFGPLAMLTLCSVTRLN